jgi:antitoxin YefM
VLITASEARKNLFRLIEKVNEDRTPIKITPRGSDAVLLSRADYEALEETRRYLHCSRGVISIRYCLARKLRRGRA